MLAAQAVHSAGIRILYAYTCTYLYHIINYKSCSWKGRTVIRQTCCSKEIEILIKAGKLEVCFCLHDLGSGKRTEFNAHRLVYPASLIKTLLLIAALKQVEGGKLALHDSYILKEEDRWAAGSLVSGSGVMQFAAVGTAYTVEQLLFLMIAISDNVATNIMVNLVGLQKVNELAHRLGLKNTRFHRKMYELNSPKPSNVSTAADLTTMLLYLEKRRSGGDELARLAVDIMKKTADKNRIGRRLIKEMVANKVGTVNGMIGDMALLYPPERPPLALTILVLNPPTTEQGAKLIGDLSYRVACNYCPAIIKPSQNYKLQVRPL